MDKDTS